MGGAIGLLLFFGIFLVAGPIVANTVGSGLGMMSTIIMMVFGIGLIALSGLLITIARLYQKTKASEALVRTGMGGLKVIKDGGVIAIPVMHQLVRVALETLRLVVSREGSDALLTGDKLRVDIRAEFYVRVQPDEESIQNAARSLGDKMGNPDAVRAIVEDKLVSALRTVAATRTLEALNSDRKAFMEEVTRIVTPDLAHNGLTLETATISKLDQTDPKMLRDDNIFDAQGKRTIAEITQEQLTARNRLEREGEKARKQQDVETRKCVLTLEQEQAQAEAEQKAQIVKVQAEQTQEARRKEIEAQQTIELAAVAKSRAVEVAERAREQAVEVATRAKDKAIAEAEKERAAAEKALAEAEAEREAARQGIKTVEVKTTAERDKEKAVIQAQADAEKKYVEQQRETDAEAYRVRVAAEAKKAAADAEAEAIRKRADAEAEAAKKRAGGKQAEEMVPVAIKQAEVDVEARRVEVLQQELQAREEHGKSGQEFELAKLRITKEAEVRIAAAEATAKLLGKVEAHVFGTPADLERMTAAWMKGMGITGTIDGLLAGASDETLGAGAALMQTLIGPVSALAKRFGITAEEMGGPKSPLTPE